MGTSIGQIRVAGNVEKDKIVYDLLHGYHEGGKILFGIQSNFFKKYFVGPEI